MQLLILKAGSTFQEIKDLYGDFDQWIINRVSSPERNIHVVDVQNEMQKPDFAAYQGIFITGAHENVTEQLTWMIRLKQWIQEIHQFNIPMLGICFGHQMIAEALGGKVGYHPKGEELGIAEIFLTSPAESTHFMIPQPSIYTFVSHEQTVIELPKGAVSRAKNSHEPNHFVEFTPAIFGVQFHPEFTPEITQIYWQKAQRPGTIDLQNTGKQADASGKILMEQFIGFCTQKNR